MRSFLPISKTVRANLRTEDGFGMIELMIAIVMLNVGILAIIGAFSSSQSGLERASRTATASTLAEKQMELYRAQIYANIYLDTALTATASANVTYNTDAAYNATQFTLACPGSPSSVAAWCNPRQTVTGPDGVSYQVDTYIVKYTPGGGREGRKVTVVVRHTTSLKTLARVASTFDEATG